MKPHHKTPTALIGSYNSYNQSRAPSHHSCISPPSTTTKKMEPARRTRNENPTPIAAKMGKSSTISTSKIKKIIARRKKRREKGKRAEELGSKPHSKGEFFSRSPREQRAIENPIRDTITANNNAISPESKTPTISPQDLPDNPILSANDTPLIRFGDMYQKVMMALTQFAPIFIQLYK